jgi:cytochrome P450
MTMPGPRCDISLAQLDRDPHPLLARARERSPACWVPELGGWLVTGYDAAVAVLTDPATFTVDDPRFTTARVTGPSMLSRDGAEHARHRAPFAHAFRRAELTARLGKVTVAEAERLADSIAADGQAELRETVAGPLAASVMAEALGLAGARVSPPRVLAWYRDIVAAVAALPAARDEAQRVPVASFGALAERLRAAMAAGKAPLLAEAARAGALDDDEVISNAAVVLFGGIETTEGMICNVLLHVLGDPGVPSPRGPFGMIGVDVVEESLRLEPAAAVVDRYATRDADLGEARIRRGDLVTVSIAGANRDPAVFDSPDRFDARRPNVGRHLAFARGPHFCIGAELARLEAVTAVNTLLARLPGLRLDGSRLAQVTGLVFRKPGTLHATWR